MKREWVAVLTIPVEIVRSFCEEGEVLVERLITWSVNDIGQNYTKESHVVKSLCREHDCDDIGGYCTCESGSSCQVNT